jgi:hypothetical protein
MTIDVLMYLGRDAQATARLLRPLAGLCEASTHRVVTHELAE